MERRGGFTLVEVIGAILVLVVGIASVTFVFGRGIYGTTDAENLETAAALAQEKMESIRGTAFGSIAGEPRAGVSGWTGYEREVTVSEPGGTNSNFKQVVVSVYWSMTGGELSTSLTTYVANVTNG